MGLPSVLITGANGFIGTCLLDRLPMDRYERVYGSVRRASPATPTIADRPNVTWLEAELPDRPLADLSFPAVDTVIHLAASTGKARPATHFATNVAGTRLLLDQCARRSVRNFLFVSTIAVKFRDISRYYYAQSKQQAEAAVAASGLRFTILRPTIVVGPGGGAWQGLAKLGKGLVSPVFGSGKTRVQPIHVEDLVSGLLAILHEDRFDRETLEFGGPEVTDIDGLIRRIRRAHGRLSGPVLHLPLRPLQTTLGWLEGWLFPVLPLTAGQLSTFAEDSTIRPNSLFDRLAPQMKSIDEMIALATGERRAS